MGKGRHGKAGVDLEVPVPEGTVVRDASGGGARRPGRRGGPVAGGAGWPGRTWERPFPLEPPPGAIVRRARRAGGGTLAGPRAQAHGRRGPRRFPERREEHPHLADFRGQAQDRRLSLHHSGASSGRGPFSGSRVRGGGHSGSHRGRQRRAGAWAIDFSATSNGPGPWWSSSTWPRTTGRSPAEQERVLLEELRRYQPELLSRPRLVVGSRTDLASPDLAWEGERVSALTGAGVASPGRPHRRAGGGRPGRTSGRLSDSWCTAPRRPGSRWDESADGGWAVSGRAAQRAVALSDLTNPEALAYAQGRLRRLGVDRALARAGARAGDRVSHRRVRVRVPA